MSIKKTIQYLFLTIVLGISTGCAVTNDQETVGAYIDDSVVTTSVKSKLFEEKSIDAMTITVETLNGTVMLSGFVKNISQKNIAETLAEKVKGVRSVKNQLSVKQ